MTVLQRHPAHLDSLLLLADIYQQQQRFHEAEVVVRNALASDTRAPRQRFVLQRRLESLQAATAR